VLGCTHYPLLLPVIEAEARDVLGDGVAIVDSARATASEVRDFLASRGLTNPAGGGWTKLLVTDLPKNFSEMAERFLGHPVADVEAIDL
jgi:glutamate racemase